MEQIPIFTIGSPMNLTDNFKKIHLVEIMRIARNEKNVKSSRGGGCFV